MSRFEAACAGIDRANADDPRNQELAYSRRMAAWVDTLAPRASEELKLAARAQHIRRWTTPRSDYPEGRAGYLKWRETLKKFHADTAAAILKEAGYGEESIAKVRMLILRKNAASDPEGQTLEDAACLVFLEFEFAEFARKTDPAKVVDILRKTWEKMSSAGQRAALGLAFGPEERALVERALA